MLLVETEPIKAVVRLILREPTVSNFCKSWLYLKAMVENDANIRIQLENGYNHWEFEGGMEQTFTFHPDWFANTDMALAEFDTTLTCSVQI